MRILYRTLCFGSKAMVAIALALLSFSYAGAQNLTPVPADEQSSIVALIKEATSGTKTIKADFVQEKTMQLLGSKMISRGKMLYVRPSSFRWEYVSPYSYIFAIADGKVIIKSAQGKSEIDIRQSKLFAEIASIMMGSVTGESLEESKDFTFSLFSSADKKLYMAELTPVKKEIKQMFKAVKLFFLPDKKVVDKIIMTDRSGDETIIELKNIVLNEEIEAAHFIIK